MTKGTGILLALLGVAAATSLVASCGRFAVGSAGATGSGGFRSHTDSTSRSGAIPSLPYVTWVPSGETADLRGVTRYDAEASHPGLNLFSPRNSHRALLLDMSGNVVHKWALELEAGDTWQIVKPLERGELLVVVTHRRLMRIDRDSRVLWSVERRVHHDVAVADSGESFVLVNEEREIERDGRRLMILDDVIVRVSPQGEVLGESSLYDLFADRIPRSRWKELEGWFDSGDALERIRETSEKNGFALLQGEPPDLLHTNSIEVLPSLPGLSRPGALLISIRELDLIAIVELEERRVAWSWGPSTLDQQHHPSLLDNGNILVFDNQGGIDGTSRIVEVNPFSREIVWQYNGDPPESFFSELRGGCQRLPNGNTLITESERGRVFEIRPDGETVWEFYNPMTRNEGRERVAIYRMIRLPETSADWRTGRVTSRR